MEYMHETGVHQFPQGAEEKGAFEYAHGMNMWKFMEKNEKYRKIFDTLMVLWY